jgi:5-methylcytosine-specific restriction endonuclease McrA
MKKFIPAETPPLFTFAGDVIRKGFTSGHYKYSSKDDGTRRFEGQLKLGDYDVMITPKGSINTHNNEVFIKQCESCGDEYSFVTNEDLLKMKNYVKGYPTLNNNLEADLSDTDVQVKLIIQNDKESVAALVAKFKKSIYCAKGCKKEITRQKEAKMLLCLVCEERFDSSISQSSKWCGEPCKKEYELKKKKTMKKALSTTQARNHKLKRDAILAKFVAGECHGGTGNQGAVATYIYPFLKEYYGHKCQRCGYNKPNKFTGNPVLHVNHIDHNPYNHMFDNLEVICPNCHGEVTQVSYMNKGRELRDELLAKGEMTPEEYRGNNLPSTSEIGGYTRKEYETEDAKNIMRTKVALTTNKKIPAFKKDKETKNLPEYIIQLMDK